MVGNRGAAGHRDRKCSGAAGEIGGGLRLLRNRQRLEHRQGRAWAGDLAGAVAHAHRITAGLCGLHVGEGQVTIGFPRHIVFGIAPLIKERLRARRAHTENAGLALRQDKALWVGQD